GFNAWSGNLLWEEKSAGRPSELKILNGIVYFTTGGDGRLHALDIQTGKHIWKLKCPDKNYDPSYPFKSDGVAVFQGKNGKKGKIIASGFINAYCYEAIR
ncbi:MAG TPA: PQQ-binding-like beta-propeller repeat protein, partial [Cyclobacteriaceae bacterium]